MWIGLIGLANNVVQIGASSGKRAAAWDGLIWFGVMVLAIMVCAVVLAWFRKRIRNENDKEGPAFSLEDLRQLKSQGDLSDEEFELLKQKTLDGF